MTFKKAAEIAVLEAMCVGGRQMEQYTVSEMVKYTRSYLSMRSHKKFVGIPMLHKEIALDYAKFRAEQLVRKTTDA